MSECLSSVDEIEMLTYNLLNNELVLVAIRQIKNFLKKLLNSFLKLFKFECR